ncbi:MAG: Cys-tRNA(Pro) deacylase [Acidimicrobiales bacterium]|nr:Cys-tRNA(Pro) deacylase [Acidimicrobiales bacterium]
MTPAVVALQRAKIAHHVLSYDHDPDAASYGAEAAEALGLDPASVFKTLVVRTDDGRLAVGVVPVTGQLDLKAVAGALGAKKAELADPADAQRATGYVVGGISPLGQRKRLPTVVDDSALALDLMHVSAGRRGLEVALAPSDLVALTAAATAPIARG